MISTNSTSINGVTLISAFPSDIAMHQCGVRPLPYVDAKTPAAITRRHQLVWNDAAPLPLVSLVGGKLTTCRSLAEETAAAVLKRIGRNVITTSRDRPIPATTIDEHHIRAVGPQDEVLENSALCGVRHAASDAGEQIPLPLGEGASSALADEAGEGLKLNSSSAAIALDHRRGAVRCNTRRIYVSGDCGASGRNAT